MDVKISFAELERTRHHLPPAVPPSARVWANSDIVAEMATWLAEKDLVQLQRVNRTCAKALNTPSQWRRRFRPALVDWSTRRVRTYIDWREQTRSHWQKGGPRRDASRILGVYDKELWRLTADLVPPAPPVGSNGALLAMWRRVPGVALHDALGVDVERAQQMAFVFFLRRGLRLRVGLAVKDYREQPMQQKAGLALMGLGFFGVEVGVLLLMLTAGEQKCTTEAVSFAVAGMLSLLVGTGLYCDPTTHSRIQLTDADQKAIDTMASEVLAAAASLPDAHLLELWGYHQVRRSEP